MREVFKLVKRVQDSDGTDTLAAEDLLREFCSRGSGGDALTEYFIRAFREILIGDDPKAALGLKSGPGRKRDRELPRRNFEMALKIQLLKRDLKHDKAISMVARDFNVSWETARDAWRANKVKAKESVLQIESALKDWEKLEVLPPRILELVTPYK